MDINGGKERYNDDIKVKIKFCWERLSFQMKRLSLTYYMNL